MRQHQLATFLHTKFSHSAWIPVTFGLVLGLTWALAIYSWIHLRQHLASDQHDVQRALAFARVIPLAITLVLTVLLAILTVLLRRKGDLSARMRVSEDHLRAVAALREREEFSRAVFDSAPVGIMVLDADTHQVETLNHAAATMFNRSFELLLTKAA